MKSISQIFSYLTLLVVVILTPLTTIAAAKNVSDQKLAEKILQRYNLKSGVQVKLDMQTEKKVLGTKTSDKGVITHQKGKLNISLEGEKKSEMIFDGKKAYLISYPDQELDPNGKRKIILLKVNDQNQLGLLTNLFNQPQKFFSNFKTQTLSSDSKALVLKLEDKSKTLKDITLSFSKEANAITQLTYTDDVGSEIQINFEKPNFKAKILPKLFKYNALKSDEVVSQ